MSAPTEQECKKCGQFAEVACANPNCGTQTCPVCGTPVILRGGEHEGATRWYEPTTDVAAIRTEEDSTLPMTLPSWRLSRVLEGTNERHTALLLSSRIRGGK